LDFWCYGGCCWWRTADRHRCSESRLLLPHQPLPFRAPQGKLPDYNDPVILPAINSSVEHFCNRLHKAIIKQFKYGLVWGSSVKHRPQKVGKEHILHDEDIVQIVKRV
jgi:TGS domain